MSSSAETARSVKPCPTCGGTDHRRASSRKCAHHKPPIRKRAYNQMLLSEPSTSTTDNNDPTAEKCLKLVELACVIKRCLVSFFRMNVSANDCDRLVSEIRRLWLVPLACGFWLVASGFWLVACGFWLNPLAPSDAVWNHRFQAKIDLM